MNANEPSWFLRNKWTLVLITVPVLLAAWWAFRPEKLFINQKVNEAPPAGLSSEPQAVHRKARREGARNERARDHLSIA